jgi:hypothetical protein
MGCEVNGAFNMLQKTREMFWSATLADFEPDFGPSQHFQTLSLNCISLLLRLLQLMRATII